MGREGELCNEYNLLCPGKSIAHFSRGIEGLPQWIRSQWMRMFVEKKRCKGSRIGSPFIEVEEEQKEEEGVPSDLRTALKGKGSESLLCPGKSIAH